jgi:hypothetical protein
VRRVELESDRIVFYLVSGLASGKGVLPVPSSDAS